MWLVLLLVGCGDASITLGDKGGDDTGAVDTGPGDTDDTYDTDVVEADERFSGTFAGSADIHAGGGGGGGGGRELVTCEGAFELVLGADGAWAGEAECAGRDGVFAGTIDGTTEGGRLLGRFVYTGYGYTGEATVALDRTDTHLDGTVQDQDQGIALSMVATGTLVGG